MSSSSSSSAPTLPVSLNVFGIFSVKGGSRVSSTKGSSTIYHQVYQTAIACTSGQRLPAELRVYSPPGDHTLPDNTVVMIMAKALFPQGAPALLEALQFAPFPGNPDAATYEDVIPDFTVPVVIGLGHVGGTHHTLSDNSRSFPVTAGDFIKNLNQTCIINCVYPAGNRRWISTPIPPVNTCIQFGGACREVSDAGPICINLDYIVLGVGPRSISAPTTASTASNELALGETASSPAKRKRFSADANLRAEPSTPTPVRHTPVTPKKSVPASSSPFPPQILVPASPDVFSSPASTSFPAPHFDTGYLNYLAFMQQAQMHQAQQASAAKLLAGPLLPMPPQPNMWFDPSSQSPAVPSSSHLFSTSLPAHPSSDLSTSQQLSDPSLPQASIAQPTSQVSVSTFQASLPLPTFQASPDPSTFQGSAALLTSDVSANPSASQPPPLVPTSSNAQAGPSVSSTYSQPFAQVPPSPSPPKKETNRSIRIPPARRNQGNRSSTSLSPAPDDRPAQSKTKRGKKKATD